jgi:hypothetical protein
MSNKKYYIDGIYIYIKIYKINIYRHTQESLTYLQGEKNVLLTAGHVYIYTYIINIHIYIFLCIFIHGQM